MGKRYSSYDLKDLIEADGWLMVSTEGSHRQYRHPTKKGRVTIPHPKKDLPIGTARSVLKQAGLIGKPAAPPPTTDNSGSTQGATPTARKEQTS